MRAYKSNKVFFGQSIFIDSTEGKWLWKNAKMYCLLGELIKTENIKAKLKWVVSNAQFLYSQVLGGDTMETA